MSALDEHRMADALSLDEPQPTELYACRSSPGRGGGPMVYRRFGTPREAVEHAIEHFGGMSAHRVVIEVGDQRFGMETIRRLHRRAGGRDPLGTAA